MEIRNIVTFLKVASTQNFSKAALQLGYSQSAVTVQIQQLEKELDVQLFERIGKRVFLTEQGQEFILYANEIMKDVERAKNFTGAKSLGKGKLRIGGVESICTALLPELILRMHKRYPNIDLVVQSGTTTELVERVKGNELDFVFTLDRKIVDPEWICAMEKEEEIVFMTKNNGGQNKISIDELVTKPFILTEMGAAYQYELERLLAERELRIDPILEIGNTETIRKLLIRGMGVSFLPQFTARKELENGELMRIYTDLPKVTMYSQLFYHKNKWLTPKMQRFVELVKEFMDEKL